MTKMQPPTVGTQAATACIGMPARQLQGLVSMPPHVATLPPGAEVQLTAAAFLKLFGARAAWHALELAQQAVSASRASHGTWQQSSGAHSEPDGHPTHCTQVGGHGVACRQAERDSAGAPPAPQTSALSSQASQDKVLDWDQYVFVLQQNTRNLLVMPTAKAQAEAAKDGVRAPSAALSQSTAPSASSASRGRTARRPASGDSFGRLQSWQGSTAPADSEASILRSLGAYLADMQQEQRPEAHAADYERPASLTETECMCPLTLHTPSGASITIELPTLSHWPSNRQLAAENQQKAPAKGSVSAPAAEQHALGQVKQRIGSARSRQLLSQLRGTRAASSKQGRCSASTEPVATASHSALLTQSQHVPSAAGQETQSHALWHLDSLDAAPGSTPAPLDSATFDQLLNAAVSHGARPAAASPPPPPLPPPCKPRHGAHHGVRLSSARHTAPHSILPLRPGIAKSTGNRVSHSGRSWTPKAQRMFSGQAQRQQAAGAEGAGGEEGVFEDWGDGDRVWVTPHMRAAIEQRRWLQREMHAYAEQQAKLDKARRSWARDSFLDMASPGAHGNVGAELTTCMGLLGGQWRAHAHVLRNHGVSTPTMKADVTRYWVRAVQTFVSEQTKSAEKKINLKPMPDPEALLMPRTQRACTVGVTEAHVAFAQSKSASPVQPVSNARLCRLSMCARASTLPPTCTPV